MAQRDAENDDADTAEEGYEEWKLAEIQAGLAEAVTAEAVPHEKVVAWLRS
jgi:predicted transcriptional regulator